MQNYNFLITDVNSSFNKGDAAIGLGMIKVIQKFYPNSKISLLSPTPNEDKKIYSKYGVETYMQLHNFVNRKIPAFLYKIIFLFKIFLYLLFTKLNFFPISKEERKILELYRNSDLILSCSGGRVGGNNYGSIFNSFIPMYFAKKLGKKVYFCAQSVEPFRSNFIKNLARIVFNRIDLITVREPTSMEVVKSLNIKTPTYLTGDLAFLLEPETLESTNYLLKKHGIPEKNKLRIGISVTNWRIYDKDPKIKQKQYVNEITHALEKIIKNTDCLIIFFPQVIFGPSEDDRILSNEIKNKLDASLVDKVFILNENFEPNQLKALMGELDLFIGTRMHSCIFALSMNVPTLMIGYENKAWGIMSMLDLTEFIIDIRSLTSEKIVSVFNKMLEERLTITKKIKSKIPQLEREALRNGDFLEKLLASEIKT